jgi:hypothetical protein
MCTKYSGRIGCLTDRILDYCAAMIYATYFVHHTFHTFHRPIRSIFYVAPFSVTQLAFVSRKGENEKFPLE